MYRGASLAPFQSKWTPNNYKISKGFSGSVWISLSELAGIFGPNWDQIVDQWAAP
jgi:hypothetical protein